MNRSPDTLLPAVTAPVSGLSDRELDEERCAIGEWKRRIRLANPPIVGLWDYRVPDEGKTLDLLAPFNRRLNELNHEMEDRQCGRRRY